MVGCEGVSVEPCEHVGFLVVVTVMDALLVVPLPLCCPGDGRVCLQNGAGEACGGKETIGVHDCSAFAIKPASVLTYGHPRNATSEGTSPIGRERCSTTRKRLESLPIS